MALTSNDETDILLPLYRGMHETPPFNTFLERIRRRTGAQFSTLILDGDEPEASLAALLPADPFIRNRFRPFRAYALSEISEVDATAPDRIAALRRREGIVDARFVRVPLAAGDAGWLAIGKERVCTASDSALLSSVAPYLQSVLATWQDMNRERAAATLTSDAMARTGAGWILFDADARIVAIEMETARRLENATGTTAQIGERLHGVSPDAVRRLVAAAQRLAAKGGSEADNALLNTEPRIEAILAKPDPTSDAAVQFPNAAMIAWCRFPAAENVTRAATLAGLYELPRREAELAIALSDGRSISEAAQALGLTLETARNYSKRLYAKLDVSGQAQLVRLVHRSGAVLA